MATKMTNESIIEQANELCKQGLITPANTAKVATYAWVNNCSPRNAMDRLGLRLLHDPGDPEKIVREVIENNKYAFCMTVVGIRPVNRFFGLCLKHAKGKANPVQLKEHLVAVIEEWKTNKSEGK